MSDQEEPEVAEPDTDGSDPTPDIALQEAASADETTSGTETADEPPTKAVADADTDGATEDDAANPAEAPPTLQRSDLASSRRLPDRLGPLVLGAVALLMVGFIVGRVSSGDQPDEPPTTTMAPFVFPAGDQDRSGYWGFGGVVPVLSDTFDRSDDPESLGDTDTGEPWNAVAGTWGVESSRAVAAPGAEPAFATVNGGPADRLTEASLMVVEPGAGITFRFQDADNHWSLTAAPSRGVWELRKVVRGESTLVAEAAGPVADGTTVSVAQRGAELQVLLDGVEATRLSDPALQTRARSGLVAGADSTGLARWDRFYVGSMPEGG